MTPAAPKPARRGEPRRRYVGPRPLEQVPVPYSPTGRAVLGALFGVLAHVPAHPSPPPPTRCARRGSLKDIRSSLELDLLGVDQGLGATHRERVLRDGYLLDDLADLGLERGAADEEAVLRRRDRSRRWGRVVRRRVPKRTLSVGQCPGSWRAPGRSRRSPTRRTGCGFRGPSSRRRTPRSSRGCPCLRWDKQ